jgi:hypothetical protein
MNERECRECSSSTKGAVWPPSTRPCLGTTCGSRLRSDLRDRFERKQLDELAKAIAVHWLRQPILAAQTRLRDRFLFPALVETAHPLRRRPKDAVPARLSIAWIAMSRAP